MRFHWCPDREERETFTATKGLEDFIPPSRIYISGKYGALTIARNKDAKLYRKARWRWWSWNRK